MTREEASNVLATLNAGFPRDTLERPSVLLWIDVLEGMDSYDAALDVARAMVFGGDRFPSIREFRQAYRAERERRNPPALEQGPRTKSPEWVLVWTWLRNQGDWRTLPQQPGWDMSTDRMSQQEYERERQRWLAETGGEGEARLPSAKAL